MTECWEWMNEWFLEINVGNEWLNEWVNDIVWMNCVNK